MGQRRADALGLLAESALAAGLDRGTAGERYQVVLHVEVERVHESPTDPHSIRDVANSTKDVSAETYRNVGRETSLTQEDRLWTESGPASDGSGQHSGHAVVEVGDGATDVSAETYERLACDASVVVMQHDEDGSVLDVGRRTRTIPPAIRRALMAREPYCQFPGCTARRCDAHHLTHWAHGGPTCLDNLVHLCRWHHRAVHEGDYRITRDVWGTVCVVRPDGRPLPNVPPRSQWTDGCSGEDPLAPTAARLVAAGAAIDPHTTRSAWDGHPFDVGWAIDVLRGRPIVELPDGCNA